MPDVDWYYARGNDRKGPVGEGALRQLAAAGDLRGTDLVWSAGMPQWQPAAQAIAGLFPAAPAGGGPPPVPPVPMAPAPGFAPSGGAAPIGYYGGTHPAAPPQPGIGDDAGMRWLMPVGRSGWAIAAGYLGLFSFVILPAPIALIISIFAVIDLKKHPEKHGWGRAIFGLIAGTLGTIVLSLMVFSMLFTR